MATIAAAQSLSLSSPAASASCCVSQCRNKATVGPVLVPVSTFTSRFNGITVVDRFAFGRGLQLHNGKPGHGTVALRAAQQTVEATPNSSDYQSFVTEVKIRLEKERADLPVGKNGRDDEDLLLWFLRDRKFDVDATVSKLIKALDCGPVLQKSARVSHLLSTYEWRKEFGVDMITESSIRQIAATGEACLHTSPDNEGKPVIIVTAANHYPNDEKLLDSKKLCIYLIEKALGQLPPGGENLLGIFDLRSFQQKNGDLKFVKFLIDVFFNYYPKRLGQVLFVDAPFIFQPGWKMVKPLVGKYAALVRFCCANEVRCEYFTPDTVPENFRQ